MINEALATMPSTFKCTNYWGYSEKGKKKHGLNKPCSIFECFSLAEREGFESKKSQNIINHHINQLNNTITFIDIHKIMFEN